MWFWREEHNTHPTPIDYAPGIVILSLAGVKTMSALLTNQMTGIFRWGIDHFRITAIWPGDRIRRPEHPTENEVRRCSRDESV